MLIVMAAGAADIPSVDAPPSMVRYPEANQLLDRNADLKEWAVRHYDRNKDGWLTLYEAQPAIDAFREIADGNGDGRVTTHEYGEAVAFIRARY